MSNLVYLKWTSEPATAGFSDVCLCVETFAFKINALKKKLKAISKFWNGF